MLVSLGKGTLASPVAYWKLLRLRTFLPQPPPTSFPRQCWRPVSNIRVQRERGGNSKRPKKRGREWLERMATFFGWFVSKSCSLLLFLQLSDHTYSRFNVSLKSESIGTTEKSLHLFHCLETKAVPTCLTRVQRFRVLFRKYDMHQGLSQIHYLAGEENMW